MILLSYDLSGGGHTAVKDSLKRKGYQALLANTPIPDADPTPSGGAFSGVSSSFFGNALENLERATNRPPAITSLRGVAEALLKEGFPLVAGSGAFSSLAGAKTELPNTTLLHSTKSREQAIVDLYNALQQYNFDNKIAPGYLTAILCSEFEDYIFWGRNLP